MRKRDVAELPAMDAGADQRIDEIKRAGGGRLLLCYVLEQCGEVRKRIDAVFRCRGMRGLAFCMHEPVAVMLFETIGHAIACRCGTRAEAVQKFIIRAQRNACIFRHLADEGATGIVGDQRLIRVSRQCGKCHAHHAETFFRNHHGILRIDRDIHLRRRVMFQDCTERRPVGFFRQRHDQLDASLERQAEFLDGFHRIQGRGNRRLVILCTARDQSARFGHGVEFERRTLPFRRIGRLHIAVGDDAEALFRLAETDHQHGAVVGEIEIEFICAGAQVFGEGTEFRLLGIHAARFVYRLETHQVGQQLDLGIVVAAFGLGSGLDGGSRQVGDGVCRGVCEGVACRDEQQGNHRQRANHGFLQ